MKKINIRTIQIVLGLLWLFDGALQLQPKMFTSAFASQVIALSAHGQPGFVAGIIHFGIRLFLLHPVFFDILIAIAQLSIGLLILLPKTLKIGLLLSIVWGLFVWVFGEGFGGIFGGQTTLLMGAPGAALIYVLLAVAVYPRAKLAKPKIAYWLAFAWLVFWVGGGIYQLLPPNNSVSAVGGMVVASGSGAPTWMANTDSKVGGFIRDLGKHSTQSQGSSKIVVSGMGMEMGSMQTYQGASRPGLLFILSLAVLEVVIGVGVLASSKYRKLSIGLGMLLSLCFWFFGQSLGSIYTGHSTDPNSGPLFVILGLAIMLIPDLDTHLANMGLKISNSLLGQSKPGRELMAEPASDD